MTECVLVLPEAHKIMGKITGFLEIDRQEQKYPPASDRVRHFRELKGSSLNRSCSSRRVGPTGSHRVGCYDFEMGR